MGCGRGAGPSVPFIVPDTVIAVPGPDTVRVVLVKELTYDRHTLGDEYPYLDSVRHFQWNKIRRALTVLETEQREPVHWITLQNYKNRNGVAPQVQEPSADAYRSSTDSYGVGRHQAVPLYAAGNLDAPERYGRDGALLRYLKDTAGFVKVSSLIYGGQWYVPEEYVELLPVQRFDKIVFVDRTNQNIAAVESGGEGSWLVRSMNPATTGRHNPPYQQETPAGVFVVQERKPRMFYLHDGTPDIAGYAPWASRFTRGGYIHGVPLNNPRATERDYVEFSSTLGTVPRSHMCVRCATSHAKFIYDWAEPLGTLVMVFD